MRPWLLSAHRSPSGGDYVITVHKFRGVHSDKVLLLLAFSLAQAVGRLLAGEVETDKIAAVLAASPAAELPARAAELVMGADATHRPQMTVAVVNVALGMNPAAVLALVGSVAETSPDMAATAATTAVTRKPNEAVDIARAAAAAAPGAARWIVEGICRVVPADYDNVARAVLREVPGAGPEILTGVAVAIPELKGEIEAGVQAYHGAKPVAGAVLTAVAASTAADRAPAPNGRAARDAATNQPPRFDVIWESVPTSGPEGVSQPLDISRP